MGLRDTFAGPWGLTAAARQLAMAAAAVCAVGLMAEPALALDCTPAAAPSPPTAAPAKAHKPHRKPTTRKTGVRRASVHRPKAHPVAAHRPKAARKAPRVIRAAAPAAMAARPKSSITCQASPPGPLMSVIPMTFAEAAPPPASGDFASAPQLPAYAQEVLGTDAAAIEPDTPKPGVGPSYGDIFGHPIFPGGGLVPIGFGGGFGGWGQPPVIGQPPEGGNPPTILPPAPPIDQPPTVIETFPGPGNPPGGGQPPTVIVTVPPEEPPFIPQPPQPPGSGGGGAVPEPGTWALMILGFGLAGAALRRAKPALRA